MNWMTAMMSMKKMEKALKKAGINPDPSGWTHEDIAKAESILNAVQAEHIKSLNN